MPQYFFHLTNGVMPQYFFHLANVILEDVDGESFDDVAGARQHAVEVAAELRWHGRLGGRSIAVTDEQGVVVFETKPCGPLFCAVPRSS